MLSIHISCETVAVCASTTLDSKQLNAYLILFFYSSTFICLYINLHIYLSKDTSSVILVITVLWDLVIILIPKHICCEVEKRQMLKGDCRLFFYNKTMLCGQQFYFVILKNYTNINNIVFYFQLANMLDSICRHATFLGWQSVFVTWSCVRIRINPYH